MVFAKSSIVIDVFVPTLKNSWSILLSIDIIFASATSSTILVVPSRMKSLPTVIKEAFYLKVPIIASSVGGIPELVKDNENGLLTESENHQMLLKKINELLSDHSLQEKLSSNGYNFVIKNFTWKKIIPTYITFYENLLGS